MSDHDFANPHVSHEGIARLSHSLEKTHDQNRVLFEDIARFTKDESFRLAHMQLEHADHAFSHFYDRRDFGGLISAQQEWLKQMTHEYATFGLRYTEMFRTLTQQVQSRVESAASEFQHRAAEEMEGLGQNHGAMPAPNGMNGEQAPMPAE